MDLLSAMNYAILCTASLVGFNDASDKLNILKFVMHSHFQCNRTKDQFLSQTFVQNMAQKKRQKKSVSNFSHYQRSDWHRFGAELALDTSLLYIPPVKAAHPLPHCVISCGSGWFKSSDDWWWHYSVSSKCSRIQPFRTPSDGSFEWKEYATIFARQQVTFKRPYC